jgi:hypothetical protein
MSDKNKIYNIAAKKRDKYFQNKIISSYIGINKSYS